MRSRRYSNESDRDGMVPDQLRDHLRTLQEVIASLLDGWTLVVCSSHQRSRDALALFLPDVRHSVSSTADLLALELPSDGRLLVLCDDEHSDGGAIELIAQMRERHGAGRCRFLLCLDAAISDERLLQLWSLRPDGLSCRDNYGSGRLLQCVAVILRNGRYEDPDLSDRLHKLLIEPCRPINTVVLTRREEQVVQLIARGRSTREIAALTRTGYDHVRHLISALYTKTGVRNRDGLLVWGLERGLIRQRDLRARLRSAPAAARGNGAVAEGNRRLSQPSHR